jgi:ribosomal-protein-alanine N-acetyltransferase
MTSLLPPLEWKGSRVSLRPPTVDDIDALIAFQRENHERFAVSDPTRPDALYTQSFWQERLRRIDADLQARRGLYQLVLLHAAPSRVIGTVVVGDMTGAPFYACTLGCAIDGAFEGLGLMREALELTIEELFVHWRVHRAQAQHSINNARSANLLARLGFAREGLLRQHLRVGDTWEDFATLARVNQAWR